MSNKYKSILIIGLVLLFDQILKVYIKTHFKLGDEYVIANWFIIHFVENNGMAFGLEFGESIGKYLLTIFRIIAVSAIGWYLTRLWKRDVSVGLIISFSLIFAGAMGNIIDSAVYGVIFNESYGEVATFLPEGGGYAGFLTGRVVDMFYFPIIDTYWPDWMPFVGGDHFIFFSPIFNFADAAISCGIIALLIFYSHYLNTETHANSSHKEAKK